MAANDDDYYVENPEGSFITCPGDEDSHDVHTACDSQPTCENMSQSILTLAADQETTKLYRGDTSSGSSRRCSFDVPDATSLSGSTQFESSMAYAEESESHEGASSQMIDIDEVSPRTLQTAVSSQEQPTKKAKLRFNPNAMPYFVPATKIGIAEYNGPNNKKSYTDENKSDEDASKELKKKIDWDQITLDSGNFTPSTPYVHKFRTEICKNW
jgi:hypothetical protein